MGHPLYFAHSIPTRCSASISCGLRHKRRSTIASDSRVELIARPAAAYTAVKKGMDPPTRAAGPRVRDQIPPSDAPSSAHGWGQKDMSRIYLFASLSAFGFVLFVIYWIYKCVGTGSRATSIELPGA